MKWTIMALLCALSLGGAVGCAVGEAWGQTNVEILKRQAVERRQFFAEQSDSRKALKETQRKEVQDLLARHRETRERFSREKHTAEERHVFFGAAREEMAALRAKHKKEARELAAQLKQRRKEFHSRLKAELKAQRAEAR